MKNTHKLISVERRQKKTFLKQERQLDCYIDCVLLLPFV